ALGSRKGLESLVGDRLSAFYREPVRSGRHPCLGALYSSELTGEVPGPVRVVLVLVEGFRSSVARLVDDRLRLVAAQVSNRLLDARPLACQQFASAIRFHGGE